MDLASVWADIADDHHVTQTRSPDSPLAQLVKLYGEYSERIDRLPSVTNTLTGLELKAAIASMEPQDQVSLAYHYYQYRGMLGNETEPMEQQEADRRWWVVKTMVYTTIGLFAFGIGSITTFMFKAKDGAAYIPVISGLFHETAEIAKVLVGG